MRREMFGCLLNLWDSDKVLKSPYDYAVDFSLHFALRTSLILIKAIELHNQHI